MDQLRVMTMFRRVVELSSFSAAAADLDIDSATMSRQIAQLENELGAKLLFRTTRNISATAAGKEFYSGCVQTLDSYETARRQVIDMSGSPRGLLRISAPMSFGIIHVAPLVSLFLKQYPDTQIELVLDDRVVDIIGESFDVAIRIRTALPDSALMQKTVSNISRVIVASPGYIAKHGLPKNLVELSKHNCLEYTLSSSAKSSWNVSDAINGTSTVEIAGSLKVNNSIAMVSSLLAGIGIGLLPRFAVRDALLDGQLVELLPEHSPLPHHLYLVHGHSRLSSVILKSFSQFFESEMKTLEDAGAI